MSLSVSFQPKQAFLDWMVENHPATTLGYGGSRGGAKSGAIRRIALNRRIKHPNTSCQILRRVWDDVSKNHVNKMWEEFPDLREFYRAESHCIELPEKLGAGKIFFDSAEHKVDVDRKAFGPEYMDIFVDQAEQFTEDELKQLKTTCRWPSMPEHACKFVLTFNPGGVGAGYLQRIFYLKEYHERETADSFAFLQAYGWDNVEWARAALASDGYTGDCRGQKCGKCGSCVYYSWSNEVRFQYYITRTQYGQEQNALPAHLRAGQLLGDFKKFAGQYFSNFDEAIHVWDLSDIVFQPHWPVWMSIDWGYIHSTSVHWHTQAGQYEENGQSKRLVVTFRELVRDHLSERALAEEIVAANDGLKVLNVYGGHDLWQTETSGRTKEAAMSEVFRSHGLPSLKRASIDRIDGWRFLHRSLDESEWIITSNCKEAIRAIPTAVYNDKPGKEEDILKTNTTADDILDELRYGLYSQYTAQDMPLGVKMAQAVAHLTDKTSRNIQLMKLHSEFEQKRASSGVVNNRSRFRHARMVPFLRRIA